MVECTLDKREVDSSSLSRSIDGYAEMVDRLILEISGSRRMGSSPITPISIVFNFFTVDWKKINLLMYKKFLINNGYLSTKVSASNRTKVAMSRKIT